MMPTEHNTAQRKDLGGSHAGDRKALAAEIRAIATIGRVLGDIQDVATRARVLGWANARFIPEACEDIAVPSDDHQLTLAGDALDDLFDQPREAEDAERAAFVPDLPTTKPPRRTGLLVDFRMLGRRMARGRKRSA
jgi:hypothetical protein